ncbi:TPA: hypothetical protein ACKREH_000226 [Proteus mirabilis]
MSFTKSMLALAVMAVSFTSHAAKQADLMIVDGTVLTMDAQNQVIEQGTVVVKENKIIAVGGPELTQEYQANKVIQVIPFIIESTLARCCSVNVSLNIAKVTT